MPHPLVRIVLPALVVATGLAGWLALRAPSPVQPRSDVTDDTATWCLRTPGDSGPDYERPPGSGNGIAVKPGLTFRFAQEDYELHRYTAVSLLLLAETPGTKLELAVRETADAAAVLELQPGEPALARVLLHQTGQPDTELAKASRPRLLADPRAPFLLAVHFDGAKFTARVDGKPLIEWEAPQLQHGHVSLRVPDGAVRVQRLQALGRRTTQHGDWRDFSLADVLVDPEAPRAWPVHRESLIIAAAVAAGAALFLRSLCLARPRAADLLAASLVWLAGPSLALALHAIKPVPSLPWVCAVLAALTLPLALSVLSGALHGPPDSSRRGAWLSLGAALCIAAGTAALCARQSVQALEPAIAREQMALQRPPAPEWSADLATLDVGAVLEAPDIRRDMVVTATVRLAPASSLAVRLRAPDPDLARGVLFTLSSDDCLPCGFRLEDLRSFDALQETADVMPTDRPLQLELRVRGGEYVALVDGKELVRAEDRTFVAGSVLFLAPRGAVRLQDVKVVSQEPDGSLPSLAAARAAAAILPLAVLLWALCAAWLLRHPLRQVLCVGACALLPLAAAWLLNLRAPLAPDTLLLAGGGAAAVLAVHALVHAPRARRPLLTALLLLLLAGGTWAAAVPLAIEPRALQDTRDLNRMTCVDWSGERLHADALSLQHPLLRRWNDWLVRHDFRGQAAAVARRPGVPRIIALGGSSTFGYRIPPDARADWPAQLARLLRAKGGPEVLNAGYVGATSTRLYHFFREELLPYAPDMVVLCVSFNDSSAQAQGDEEAYYAAVTAPGQERSWLQDWRTRAECEREQRALTAVIGALPHDSRSSMELWRAAGMTSSPPQRFERVLRSFAELCRERGIQLVLVKEAVAGDQRLVWKEEFREAIDTVGAEFGLAVVDPTAALAASGDRDLFMDRVHLKPSGCAVVAGEIARAVYPLLKAR